MTVLAVNPMSLSNSQLVDQLRATTDKYFSRTRAIAERNGDKNGLWAVYSRAETQANTAAALDYIVEMSLAQGSAVVINTPQGEKSYQPDTGVSKTPVHVFVPVTDGEMVAAKQPVLYYSGPSSVVTELETGILQRIVPAIPAYKLGGYLQRAQESAKQIVLSYPDKPIIEMSARHDPVGTHVLFAAAAARGSAAAQAVNPAAVGYIGTSTDEASPYFNKKSGIGTMPHALINYAGSTLAAAQMFRAEFPEVPLVILPDFFGKEVTDTLEVARWFNAIAPGQRMSLRLDTHGTRYMEGLDEQRSLEVIKRNAPHMLQMNLSPSEQKNLYGKGVSVAAVFHMREQLNQAGASFVDIFASSGFSADKCKIFSLAKAPLAGIGTGSHVPGEMEPFFAKSETLGFAEVGTNSYNLRTKVGREWVLDYLRHDFAKNSWSL